MAGRAPALRFNFCRAAACPAPLQRRWHLAAAACGNSTAGGFLGVLLVVLDCWCGWEVSRRALCGRRWWCSIADLGGRCCAGMNLACFWWGVN